jgi:zinc D-Ala-D-Ala carboxypeptidase
MVAGYIKKIIDMNLSKNLSLQEVIKSQTAIQKGIKNIPNEEQIQNLIYIAENVFQPLREHFDAPIGISSGFRCKRLNDAVGGSKTSDHMEGRAIDIDADIYGGVTNKEIFDFIKKELKFDQLIWEFGTDKNPDWVHVSYNKDKNRNQVLKAFKSKGKTVYTNYNG